MKHLLLVFIILIIAACHKDEKATDGEDIVNPQTGGPVEMISGVQNAQYSEVKFEIGSSVMTVTNLGWCELPEPVPLYSAHHPCRHFDYTRLELDGRTGYLYREISSNLTNLAEIEMEPSVGGLSAMWNTPPAKWEDAMKKIAPSASHHAWTHKFDYATYARYLQAEHKFSTDRCREESHWKELRANTPNLQGNIQLTSEYFSYLDRHNAKIRTLLELDSSGRLVSISTLYDPMAFGRYIYAEDKFAEPEDLYDVQASRSNIRNAVNPRQVANITEFTYQCQLAYQIALKQVKFLSQKVEPYFAYMPFYNPAVDGEASRVLERNLKSIHSTKSFPLVQEISIYQKVGTTDYIRTLPLFENIKADHMKEFLQAYPSPMHRKDIE